MFVITLMLAGFGQYAWNGVIQVVLLSTAMISREKINGF